MTELFVGGEFGDGKLGDGKPASLRSGADEASAPTQPTPAGTTVVAEFFSHNPAQGLIDGVFGGE